MLLPNQLTVLRIVLTPLFVFFFINEGGYYLEIAIIIYIVAALTDWYDGWLARKFNYITAWGKFWDPMADKILTSAAFLCFVFVKVIPLWMVLLIIIRDFIVTAARGYSDLKHLSFPTSSYAKVKTFFQMVFLYYLLTFYTLSKSDLIPRSVQEIAMIFLNPIAVYLMMLGITIVTVHSGILYLRQNYPELMKHLKK